MAVIRNDGDINLLRNPKVVRRRPRFPSWSSQARVCAAVQNVVHTAVLHFTGLGEASASTRLTGCPILLIRAAVVAEGTAEFVGAGCAGDLAHGGDDQRSDAGDRGSYYDDGIFNVAPADQFESAGGA